MKRYTLEELRVQKGETQEEIAKNLGLRRSTYAHYENGERGVSVNLAKLLAKYHGVTVEEIIFLDKKDTKRNNTKCI